MSDQLSGNEFVINPSKDQYERDVDYWQNVCAQHALARKRDTVIIVDDVVRYRVRPPKHEQPPRSNQ